MILVDMNQISLASMMMHLNMNKTTKPDEGMVRHMILNSLRMYRSKFCNEYGELVLCYDSKHYWRRDFYPQYKAGRKKGREESNLEWDDIFSCLNEIKQELKDNFPYKHLEVYGAEADDIIASIIKLQEETIYLVVSGDKDFIQLHDKYVRQWSPVTKKLVNGIEPHGYLFEHILRGDKSDGIPNVLSADISIVDGVRQKPITKKYVENFVLHNAEISGRSETEIRNYHRNKKLIDLNETPPSLCEQIWEEYQKDPHRKRRDLLNIFVEKRLTNTRRE